MATSLEPITYHHVLGCEPQHAFAVYTERIGRWWDPRYTANPDSFESVTIEPRVGGRIYASHADLGRHDWGEVTLWQPGARVVHTFTLAQDPDHPSEVAASFASAPGGEGCAFDFQHGGWTEANADVRAKFSDWPTMLDRFVALADDRA